MSQHTPEPWEASRHAKPSSPKQWAYVLHHYPDAPYEGDLDDEWGIYPPLGEAGPIAIVAGEANVRLMVKAPEMLALLVHVPHNGMKTLHEMIGQVAGCPGCDAIAILKEIEVPS